MKRNKWMGALVALVLMMALPFTAAAETFSTEDFSIEIPDGMLKFGPTTSMDDPAWALAGIADPQAKLKEYQDMNGIAELVTEDGETSVLIMQNESDTAQQIFSLSQISEEERAQFLDGLMQSRTDEIKVDKQYVDVNGQPFYRVLVNGSFNGTEYHELLYGTVINGYSLTFDIYGGETAVTQEQEDLLLGMVQSITFPQILEKPETTVEPQDIVVVIAILVLLLLVILVPIVYLPIRNRRDKKLKAKLAQQLTEYHKTHGDNETQLGELRFANSTDCTKEAIHTFAIYQSYVKNIGSLLIGGFLCLSALVVAFALDAEWWGKLLVVGIVGYYGYKVFNMPHTLEKIQRRVYDRGVSSTAHYAFYEEGFRVSGIQSASTFPYFQIVDIRRHGHYVYLYYGPENAYMVDKLTFSLGEYEQFEKFIGEKTGKKL